MKSKKVKKYKCERGYIYIIYFLFFIFNRFGAFEVG